MFLVVAANAQRGLRAGPIMAFGQVGMFMKQFCQMAFNNRDLGKFDVENALMDWYLLYNLERKFRL